MKNVLRYYYNLIPTTIHQINNDYKCKINNVEYVFSKIDNSLEEINIIYKLNLYLLSKGFPCHQIVLNINDSPITYVDNYKYVLLKTFISNREININDLFQFLNFFISDSSFKSLKRNNWYELWTESVDYIEYQTSQFGKNYPLLKNSINYYIGLAETAISLVANINDSSTLTIAHRQITSKSKTFELYNPLNFIIDSRIRDLSEFFKIKFFAGNFNLEEMNKNIELYKLSNSEAILLIARLIYPNYYFVCYQEIVLKEVPETQISKYTEKAISYQKFLKYVYNYLQLYYKIPEIEWLKKT